MDLIYPPRRSSLASEFKAGHTPAWYTDLPADVKSYFSEVKSQINEGALTATTGLAYETTETAAPSASVTGTMVSPTATGAAASSTSKTGAAAPGPRATGMSAGLGALGLGLGVVIAL